MLKNRSNSKENLEEAQENDPGSNFPQIENLSLEDGRVDPNCIYEVKKRLVRIQYPGNVKNTDKAIHTLGGLEHIQACTEDNNLRLHLNFHPDNLLSKGCAATKDFNGGLLLKVKVKIPSSSSAKGRKMEILDYDVIGLTVVNFTFKRLVDFQYLPLVADYPETPESKCTYIYEKIMPKELPDIEWLKRDEALDMPLFFTPAVYARFDNANAKLYVNPTEKYKSSQRPEITNAFKASTKPNKQKKEMIVSKAFKKTYSYTQFAHFSDRDVPLSPDPEVMQMIERKKWLPFYLELQKLFEERPIWTKSGVLYNTKCTIENLKYLLPAVAYHNRTGPWRTTWVRFGYDPRKDRSSHIYQILDYRTSSAVGLKVRAKRYTNAYNNEVYDTLFKINKKSNQPRYCIEERSWVLRPKVLPPARQMFYQYCDLLLPEIQTMIARLPQVPAFAKCDSKNGWLPANFIDQCREIIGKYILEYVQEIMQGERVLKLGNTRMKRIKKTPASDYRSLMITNIKKGIYTKVDLSEVSGSGEGPSHLNQPTEEITEINDSDSSEDDYFENLPENINYDEDDVCVIDDEEVENFEITTEMLADIKRSTMDQEATN